MSNQTDEELFQKRFEALYKEGAILAVQLNGFTHKLFRLDGNGKFVVDVVSFCAPEQYYETENRTMNTDRAKAFFLGYPHYCYQGNAQEIVYVMPEQVELTRQSLLMKPIKPKQSTIATI